MQENHLAVPGGQAVPAQAMKIGGRYNWRNQPERLVYVGRNRGPGQGRWHQFEKVDEPGAVWCEVLDSDLHRIEETQSAPLPQSSDLHAAIMNLPIGNPGWAGNDLLLYKEGHRDARHAAAELALAHDAEVQRLKDALEEIALAGMSGTGMESEEAMTAWHARRAWKFIGIAARALSPEQPTNKEPGATQAQWSAYQESRNGS